VLEQPAASADHLHGAPRAQAMKRRGAGEGLGLRECTLTRGREQAADEQ